jgi:hypothetical protein
MAFRALPTRREYWSRFCGRRRAIIDRLDSIALVFSSPERFEELLQRGSTRSKDVAVELMALSDEEWSTFNEFVGHFRDDWQSHFVEMLYPAYFREVERRASSPP